jgi:AcrR family transcriptional regulator
MSPRSSVAEARRTRSRILERAVDLASVEGLDGLSIGRLAGDLGMSKAGVIGHFGSKERLQLETLAAAVERFRRAILDPAREQPAGLPRLLDLCDRWIAYLEGDVFPGGCFVTAASCEWDGRPGPVRDAVRALLELWLGTLEREARAAVEAGDLPAGTDAGQAAFVLNAIAMGTNQAIQLHGDAQAGRRARRAMRRALGLDPEHACGSTT